MCDECKLDEPINAVAKAAQLAFSAVMQGWAVQSDRIMKPTCGQRMQFSMSKKSTDVKPGFVNDLRQCGWYVYTIDGRTLAKYTILVQPTHRYSVKRVTMQRHKPCMCVE
jgi:hypothetical protein